MTSRIQNRSALQGAVQGILALSTQVKQSGLDPHLSELVHMRASQLNGCAVCLAMHSKALLDQGEREDRIFVLDAWRDAPWFSDRERAALAWTEAVTLLPNHEVPDEVYEQARAQFSEKELVDLTLDVIAINDWNRLNIAFRNEPTSFADAEKAEKAATAAD